jgi:CRP/FNR family transcriptional regulator, cyclic AMP receptor protein
MDNSDPGQKALDDLLRDSRTKHVHAGQIIAYEGDTPHEVFILKRGVIEVYDIDDQGNEKILHLVGPPSLVPFAFFSSLRQPLKWFYSSLTDCDLCVLSFTELKSMIRGNSALAETLINNFSDEVHELLVRLSSLGKTNAQDKVEAALKFLAFRHATKRHTGWYRVNFVTSHQLIANLCGITRESAAIVMKELQSQRIVRYPKPSILEIRPDRLAGASSL